MKTFRNPPMIKTNMTPSEIIGFENMGRFASFLKICFSPANQGIFPDRQLDKEVGSNNRKIIAEKLQHLRDNGFYPLSIDANDVIQWGMVLTSDVHIEMEKGLDKLKNMPKEKLMMMCSSMTKRFITSE